MRIRMPRMELHRRENRRLFLWGIASLAASAALLGFRWLALGEPPLTGSLDLSGVVFAFLLLAGLALVANALDWNENTAALFGISSLLFGLAAAVWLVAFMVIKGMVLPVALAVVIAFVAAVIVVDRNTP